MTNKEIIDILKNSGVIYSKGNYTPDDLEQAINIVIKKLENEPDYDIIFLCDGKACGENCDCGPCEYTLDICHAKNFRYNHVAEDIDYYVEVNNDKIN